MSKASDHPKAVEASRLLRELAYEYEEAEKIAREKGDKDAEKAHRLTSNRYWSALDQTNRAGQL